MNAFSFICVNMSLWRWTVRLMDLLSFKLIVVVIIGLLIHLVMNYDLLRLFGPMRDRRLLINLLVGIFTIYAY